MAALDEPERYSFVRNGKESGRSTTSASMATWTDTLKGTLRTKYLDLIGVAVGNKAVEAYLARKRGGLKPGFTRQGKPAPPPE